MPETLVIVGAGQAAAQAVDSLHRDGYAGRLVVVGDEPYPPYQRPPLSKKFLAGELPLERLAIKPAAFYDAAGVELRVGARAEGIDLAARVVLLADGERLGYDRLLLATGSTPRKVAVPGHDLVGVHYLRTVADVDRIRAELGPGARVAIVGGGYIGLEVAATCRGLGHEVDVVEMADRVMNRVVAPAVSAFFAAEHARAGVRVHLGARLAAFLPRAEDSRRVGAVEVAGGARLAADVVIVGVGVLPNTGLAAAAGLACDDGIVVDANCRTSDPAVYAAGDCASQASPRYGRRLRLESVDNAFEQARTAAANLRGGSVVHDRVPWFWSDQYDLKLMIVGLSHGHDRQVLRGDPAGRSFGCCYLRDGELIAMDCINSPKDYMAAKKLIAEHARLDPARLADPAVALREAVAG
ncbi:MAG TPA: FAD-dependent oxidoreductase [Steroidobacteraceae bacterium]|nr:FAD-dependent oxidoreductase [Steroidobacteraceae bacterium]